MAKRIRSAFEIAGSLLSRRSHSVSELRKKLREREVPYDEINKVISECERLGFLNDSKFAESVITTLKLRGSGPVKIRSKLMKAGVAKDIIDERLGQSNMPSDDPYSENISDATAAENALRRKLVTLMKEPDVRKRRDKALRFLAGRGFTSDTAFKAIAKLMPRDNRFSNDE